MAVLDIPQISMLSTQETVFSFVHISMVVVHHHRTLEGSHITITKDSHCVVVEVMKEAGEPTTVEHFTLFEAIILKAIIIHLICMA